jgi:hypothetical protein
MITMRARRADWWAMLVLGGIASAGIGCRHRVAHDPMAAPVLLALTPATANITNGDIVEIEVRGSGFDTLNTLRLGELTFRQVRRVSPLLLRFTVPLDDSARERRGGMAPQALPSGQYDVFVETRHGRSNPLPLTVINRRVPGS